MTGPEWVCQNQKLFVLKLLSHSFEVLEVEENINEDCIQVKKVHTETAEKVSGWVNKKSKQWLRENTWKATDQWQKKNTQQKIREDKKQTTIRVHAERHRG